MLLRFQSIDRVKNYLRIVAPLILIMNSFLNTVSPLESQNQRDRATFVLPSRRHIIIYLLILNHTENLRCQWICSKIIKTFLYLWQPLGRTVAYNKLLLCMLHWQLQFTLREATLARHSLSSIKHSLSSIKHHCCTVQTAAVLLLLLLHSANGCCCYCCTVHNCMFDAWCLSQASWVPCFTIAKVATQLLNW